MQKVSQKHFTEERALYNSEEIEVMHCVFSEGESALKESCKVTVTSDSKYVVDAITKGWLDSWIAKGWRKADGKPALNCELWQRLTVQLKRHDVTFVWVKGHAGHPYNERCDRLAVSAIEKLSLN